MTLQNLARIGLLRPHEATAEEVQRLLAAARRGLADAALAGISNETRLDCAYKAIMPCALAAMMANGSLGRVTSHLRRHRPDLLA